MTDEQLEQLMDCYTLYLLRLAYLYVKDKKIAEDIVQETFIKFHTNYAEYDERGQVKAYLAKMTVNRCKDYLKSWHYKKVQLKEKIFEQHKIQLQDRLVQEEEKYELGQAILNLPIHYRELIHYYYYENLSIRDISSFLSIPENTIKTRLRKARALLKGALQQDSWEVLADE